MTPREAIAYAWEDVPSDEVITGDSLADYLLRALMAAGYAVVPRKITPEIATALDVTPGCDHEWTNGHDGGELKEKT